MPGTVFDQPLTVQQKLEASGWQWQMQNRARSMEDLFALRPELQNSPVDRLIRGRASAFESAALNFRFAVVVIVASNAKKTRNHAGPKNRFGSSSFVIDF